MVKRMKHLVKKYSWVLVQVIFCFISGTVLPSSVAWGLAPQSQVNSLAQVDWKNVPRNESQSSFITALDKSEESLDKDRSVKEFTFEEKIADLSRGQQFFLKLPVEYLYLFSIIFVLIYIFSGGNFYSFILLGVGLLPFLHWVWLKIEPYWAKTLAKSLNWLRNKEAFLVFFAALLLVIEIMGHIGIVLGPFSTVFFVIGLVGVILFALPMIYNGFLVLMYFFEKLFRGENPFEELNEEFTKGLAFFLLIFLPLVTGAFPLDLVAVALIAVVIQLAEVLEEHMIKMKDKAVEDLKREIPDQVRVVRWGDKVFETDQLPTVPLERVEKALAKGTSIVVRVLRNEPVPKIDGYVAGFEEATRVDKSAFNGESKAVPLKEYDFLEGGSLVLNGYVDIRVDKAGDETEIGKIEASLTEFDPKGFSEVKALSDKVIKYFGLGLILIALVGFVVSGSWMVTIAALAAVCACPFLVGIPLAFVAARQNMATKNIAIRKNESFSPINVLVLDKTDTITVNKKMKLDPKQPVWMFDANEDPKVLLYQAAVVERELEESNPYARVIMNQALEDGWTRTQINKELLTSFDAKSRGAWGYVQGRRLFLGNMKQLRQVTQGDIVQENLIQDKVDSFSAEGITPIVAYDLEAGKPLGVLRVTQHLREGVDQLINNFLDMGKLTWYQKIFNVLSKKMFHFEPYPKNILPMVASGDTKNSVKYVLKQTPIKFGMAEVTPRQKTIIVYWLQNDGNVDKIKQELQGRQEPLVFNWHEFKKKFLNDDEGRAFLKKYRKLEKSLKAGEDKPVIKSNPNRVGMIGDGTNDTMALKMADVGFSFESATKFSKSAADVLLGDGDDVFKNLNTFLKMQRRTYTTIFINIFIVAVIWNLMMVSLIFAGILEPQIAALLHSMNTVLVILLSLALMAKPGTHFKELFFGGSSSSKEKEDSAKPKPKKAIVASDEGDEQHKHKNPHASCKLCQKIVAKPKPEDRGGLNQKILQDVLDRWESFSAVERMNGVFVDNYALGLDQRVSLELLVKWVHNNRRRITIQKPRFLPEFSSWHVSDECYEIEVNPSYQTWPEYEALLQSQIVRNVLEMYLTDRLRLQRIDADKIRLRYSQQWFAWLYEYQVIMMAVLYGDQLDQIRQAFKRYEQKIHPWQEHSTVLNDVFSRTFEQLQQDRAMYDIKGAEIQNWIRRSNIYNQTRFNLKILVAA